MIRKQNNPNMLLARCLDKADRLTSEELLQLRVFAAQLNNGRPLSDAEVRQIVEIDMRLHASGK